MTVDERSRNEALVETIDSPLSDRSPNETIRAVLRPELLDTLPSVAREPGDAPRPLPAISVDLQGSITSPLGGKHITSPPDRDLEILGTLGEGGMGRVFVARQRSLDRDVAIKTARDHASGAEREALLAEGVIIGSLEHPGIIPVHALGVDGGGRPVLVMKRVEGVAWSDLIHDPTHVGWEGWGGEPEDRLEGHLEILMQVCNAVYFAASRGVIHRDIKPANVLIGRFGDVYLADWGVAHRVGRDAESRRLVGTPCYMAPEMARGDRVDARTDVYLLGATLHEILTGTQRHAGDTVAEVVERARVSAPVAYERPIPEELAALANRATSLDPAERPSSALDLRRSLEGYRKHKSSAALARSAAARLEILRAKLGARGESVEREDLEATDQLIAETRFGLTQSLAQWPDNKAARRALDDLDTLLAARHERALALERLAREHDPTIASKQRERYLLAVAVVGVALTGVSLLKAIQTPATPGGLLLQSLVPLGVVATLMIALRRHMWRTSVNRRVALLISAIVTSVTVGRTIGYLAGSGVALMVAHDALMGVVLSILGGFILFRWVFWLSPIMATCVVVSTVWPAHAMTSFSLCSGASLVVAALFARATK